MASGCCGFDGAHFTRSSDFNPRIEAHNLGPEERFSVDFLIDGSKTAPELLDPFIELDGDRLVINADNGRWVYVVTGREDFGRIVVGRWPD